MSPSAVHLCVDFQKKYIVENPNTVWWSNLRQNLQILRQRLKDEGIPTIDVIHCGKPFVHAFDQGVSRYSDISERTLRFIVKSNLQTDLDWKKNSLIAIKNTCSVYKEPSIVEYIEDIGCGKIIVSGIHEGPEKTGLKGGFAVTQTAREFAKAGYEVVIVKEGTPRGLKSAPEWITPLRKRENFHKYAHVLPMKRLPDFFERSYPSEQQLLSDYFYAHSRCLTVKRISSKENEKKRDDKNNYAKILAFRTHMEKLHPEITPSNYEVHHIIPISLGGKDRWNNYAFVRRDFHLALHTFIGKQGDMAIGETGEMLIPVFPGKKLWDPPKLDLAKSPLRANMNSNRSKLDEYSIV